jgi:hypothetical protein
MFRSLRPAVILAAFTLALFLTSSLVPYATAATEPTARLTSVDFPHVVAPGQVFQVKINAWYSDKFLADIGIWDGDAGLIVQSMTFISQFSGPGNVSFGLSLTAPRTLGPWNLVAINRVWWQNAWYQDPEGGQWPFTVMVERNITLTLGSIGADSDISVDNFSYQIRNESSASVVLQPGAHVLEAPMIIQQNPDERYVFEGWSDGVDSNPYIIFLTEPTALDALYRTEYYLSAETDMGRIVGEGWYQKGTQATVAVTPTVAVPASFGILNEYQFAGWSGDSSLTNNVIVLNMDGPKQVSANWRDVGSMIGSWLPVGLLLLSCLLLVGRLVFVRSRKRHGTRLTRSLGAERRWGLTCLILILLMLPLVFPIAHAQLLPEPKAATVKIGDAEWYYWSQPGSDTCLIWLGGGVPEVAEPGFYAYFINPFDYESFGTIRFIQDLASFYCVIALQHGSAEAFDPAANRTIYQELFQPQSTTLEDVHKWVIAQGYEHTFVVGYSVGGQAAVADLTLSHPEGWTTEDGIILITVPFTQDVLRNAIELRTNLFLIYGGNLPDYEATGIQFYNNTQTEGPHGTEYIHKEFHVIDDVGHEVWTIRATGAYDTRALNLIVGFVERSKALQIGHGFVSVLGNSTSVMAARILSAQAPAKVRVREPFLIQCNVSSTLPTGQPLVLAAYDTDNDEILSEVGFANVSESVARLVIPPIPNNTVLPLSLVVLQESDGKWVQASKEYSTEVSVTNLATLTVETSYPDVSFAFDGTRYTTNSTGFTTLQTSLGQHLLRVQSFVYLSNTSRLRFVGWEDLRNETSRQIQLREDTAVEISYVQQYLLQVSSVYGKPSGAGWYDANSSATAMVQPPMLTSPPVIFSHWTTGENQSQVRMLVRATSPMAISAVWEPTNINPQSEPIYQDPVFILSLLAFIILLILNVKTHYPKSEH